MIMIMIMIMIIIIIIITPSQLICIRDQKSTTPSDKYTDLGNVECGLKKKKTKTSDKYHIYLYVHIFTYTCTNTCTNTSRYTYTYTYTYAYAYTYTHIYIYTYTSLLQQGSNIHLQFDSPPTQHFQVIRSSSRIPVRRDCPILDHSDPH